jgi:trehalose synthase
MVKQIDDYRGIVGSNLIEQIKEEAIPLKGKRVVHVNSTYQGGGVAEMLNSLVLLMNSIGIKTGWRILHGSPDFFEITKKFHNALHGMKINLSERKKDVYLSVNENFSLYTHLDHDGVIIHDPQPLPLVNFYERKGKWIWRCHIDISTPWPDMWSYAKTFINKYDAMVVSDEQYFRSDLSVPQHLILPSIDPLSTKNIKISLGTVEKYMVKNGIGLEKPIIAQISRFDKWKDPIGVLKIYKKVKKEVDCKLVMVGSFASDDPEGKKVFEDLKTGASGDPDIVLLTNATEILVNAVQRVASVIIQKSIKEGFGLTVSEALWKGTPVVASRTGGINLQIINGVNGFLLEPGDYNGFAKTIVKLLKDQKLREQMGEAGKKHVKNNFLITRQLLDLVRLLNTYLL